MHRSGKGMYNSSGGGTLPRRQEVTLLYRIRVVHIHLGRRMLGDVGNVPIRPMSVHMALSLSFTIVCNHYPVLLGS